MLRNELRCHLAEERDLMSGQMKNPSQFHYKGIADFLLREGQFFEPRPLPAGIEYLAIRHCYRNAFRTALEERYVYVEGYAVSASHKLPILHAWNLYRDGFVVRGTRMGESTSGLFFLLRWFRYKEENYPVIDDWEHGLPIFRKGPGIEKPLANGRLRNWSLRAIPWFVIAANHSPAGIILRRTGT